jgi:integrase
MATNLTSETGRSKLAPRREPYWARLEKGGFIGYRKAEAGRGTWIARWRDDDGKQEYHSFGSVESYDEACKLARALFNDKRQGIVGQAATVADACREYVKSKRIVKPSTADDAEGRFNRLVYGTKFGAVLLSKLRATQVANWRDALVREADDEDPDDARRSQDSANRNLASLKAALNHAFKHQQVGSDAAWRTVGPFKDVGRRRDVYLTLKQRQALLKHCSPELAMFLKSLMLTGARPGELAAIDLGHLDIKNKVLRIAKSKTGPRDVPLSSDAFALLKEAAKGKVGASTPLLSRIAGQRWTKEAWRDEIKEAVTAAKLNPEVVAYTLRHSAITDMLTAGVSIFVVSKLAGTSIKMIEKHYGHLLHMDAVKALDQARLA